MYMPAPVWTRWELSFLGGCFFFGGVVRPPPLEVKPGRVDCRLPQRSPGNWKAEPQSYHQLPRPKNCSLTKKTQAAIRKIRAEGLEKYKAVKARELSAQITVEGEMGVVGL